MVPAGAWGGGAWPACEPVAARHHRYARSRMAVWRTTWGDSRRLPGTTLATWQRIRDLHLTMTGVLALASPNKAQELTR